MGQISVEISQPTGSLLSGNQHAVLGFTSGTPFPGPTALVPVVGTMLLVLPAQRAVPVFDVALSLWPVRYVGLVSYSFYLWHWPVIVFATLYFNGLDWPIAVSCILVSFGLAALSYHFIETPFRHRRIAATSRSMAAVALMSCLAFVVAGNSIVALRGMPQRLPERATLALAGAEDRGAGAARCSDESWLWQDDPLDLHSASICQIGRPGSPRVMLLGDSHAAALIAAMDERATIDGVAGVAIGYNSCAPIVTMRNGSVRHPNCEGLIERAIEFAQSSDTIETVFLAARWDTYNDPIYFPGTSDALQSFRDGVEETLARFPDRVRVVVLGQVPTQNGNVPSAMAMDSIFNRPSDWALQTAQHMEITAAENQALREAAASTGARFVDLSTALCASSFCAFEEGGRPLYFDTNHLSTHGARLVVAASGL